ncbi:hypothetical protein BLA29_013202 [Euroglyphus maynei]|uniref:Uncharacterized protein n=1 Tax=Euroglyphus maynei TaxID=6958 RepID=A0A1Y3ASP2_EURMA|nr:hypothetical protein BLA29_013202 [Euroglyphus maynei]
MKIYYYSRNFYMKHLNY